MHSPSMPSGNPCLQEIHALTNPCWAQPLLGSALESFSLTLSPKIPFNDQNDDDGAQAITPAGSRRRCPPPIELVIDDGLAPTIVQHIQTALASPKRPAG